MPEMAESNFFSQTPARLMGSPRPSLTISTPAERRRSFVLNSGFDFASPSLSAGKDNVLQSQRKKKLGKSRLPSWYPRTPLQDITAIVDELDRRRRRPRRRRIAARRNEESVTDSPATPTAAATADVETAVTEGPNTQSRNSPPVVVDPATLSTTVEEIEASPGTLDTSEPSISLAEPPETPIVSTTDAVELSSARNAAAVEEEEIGSGATEGMNTENGNSLPIVVDPETLSTVIEEIEAPVTEPSILQINTGEIETVITRGVNFQNILPLQIFRDPETPSTAPSRERTMNMRTSETTRLVSIAEKKDRALKSMQKSSAMPRKKNNLMSLR